MQNIPVKKESCPSREAVDTDTLMILKGLLPASKSYELRFEVGMSH